MARRPARASVGEQERLARLEAFVENIGAVMENAVRKGMEEALEKYTPRHAHDGLAQEFARLSAEVADLRSARSYHAGAVKVEQRQRSEAQEWARTLTGPLFALAITLVGSIWALQQGGG